jgi:hypothetical protein
MFIELLRKGGQRFLFDPDSGWEINDMGSEPAQWQNYKECRNLDCSSRYADIRIQLIPNSPGASK